MVTHREVADGLFDETRTLDPVWHALRAVVPNGMASDLSIDGIGLRGELFRNALSLLSHAVPDAPRGARPAKATEAVIRTWANSGIIFHEDNNVLKSIWSWNAPPRQLARAADQAVRLGGIDVAISLLSGIPTALQQFESALRYGVQHQAVAPLESVQIAVKALALLAPRHPRKGAFERLTTSRTHHDGSTANEYAYLSRSAAQADAAFGRLGEFLQREYLPLIVNAAPVGADRYMRAAEMHLGMPIAIEPTNAWLWERLEENAADIRDVCKEIARQRRLANDDVKTVTYALDHSLDQQLSGATELYDFVLQRKEMMDPVSNLLGVDIVDHPLAIHIKPDEYSTCYYAGFAYHLPTGGRTRFSRWSEVTTLHHEGAGHHWMTVAQRHAPELSKFERLPFVGGIDEGVPTLLERVAESAGLLESPEYKLGMLLANQNNIARAIVELGFHTGQTIPTHAGPRLAGSRWMQTTGTEFLLENGCYEAATIDAMWDRICMDPGQMLTYPIGEREIARAMKARGVDVRTALTKDNGISAWKELLRLGPVGIDGIGQLLGEGPSLVLPFERR